MNNKRTYYSLAAASSLAIGILIPMSSGDEKPLTPISKTTQASHGDSVVQFLTERILTPLTKQEKRRGEFSRRMPLLSSSYDLVENTEKSSENERSFSVIVKRKPRFTQDKETSVTYLKLRYLEEENEVLVKLKDSWVGLDEHPILRMLPKAKPAKKEEPKPEPITPQDLPA